MTSGVRVASTQPAMPVPAGKRVPSSVSSPSPTTASKTSSSVSGSSSRIDDARRAEDRPRDLDDGGEERTEGVLGADDSRGDGRTKVRSVGHVPPPTLVAVR